MSFTVKGGTAKGDKTSLCYSCSNSQIVRGSRLGEEIVKCYYYGNEGWPVPFPVIECSCWSEKSAVSIHQMKAIAWIVNADRKTGKIGFLSPAERKKEGLKVGDLHTPDGTTYGGGDEPD